MKRTYANPDMAQAPSMQSGPRQATFKDEYGFRYDAQGNRLDARGNIISPQTRTAFELGRQAPAVRKGRRRFVAGCCSGIAAMI